MHRSVRLFVLCCASVLMLYGCGKHENKSAGTTAAVMHAATSAHAPAIAAPISKPPAAHVVTAPSPASSTAKPTAVIANNDDFKIATLTLGSAIDATYQVTKPGTRFADNTATLYASVASTGSTDSATLGARWRYLEGNGVLVNDIQQTIATHGPAVTTFKVQNPNRWPPGKYSVEISLNGKPVASRDFEIDKR